MRKLKSQFGRMPPCARCGNHHPDAVGPCNPRKKPAKRLSLKRKNGIKELLEIIIQTATAAIALYARAKPLVKKLKKKKGKSGADD